MGHYAKVESGIVTEVLVAEQDFIDSGALGEPSLWIKTSYNTRGGIYYTPNTHDIDQDQSKALRKNYAGIGYTYDSDRDAFIPPQPYPSWNLEEESCLWTPPVPYPTDKSTPYYWDEDNQSWVKIEAKE